MRTLLLLAAISVALPLAGCRDAIVDTPGVDQPLPPGVTSMYLKGPNVLRLGETIQYRGEPFPDATYIWTIEGEGGVTSEDPSESRVFSLHAVSPGNIVINISAYVDGRAIAVNRRFVEVR